MFERIKRFFDLKIYTVKHVREFCEKRVITPAQFYEITGEAY